MLPLPFQILPSSHRPYNGSESANQQRKVKYIIGFTVPPLLLSPSFHLLPSVWLYLIFLPLRRADKYIIDFLQLHLSDFKSALLDPPHGFPPRLLSSQATHLKPQSACHCIFNAAQTIAFLTT